MASEIVIARSLLRRRGHLLAMRLLLSLRSIAMTRFSGKKRGQVTGKFKKQATLISSFSHFLLTETKICLQERTL